MVTLRSISLLALSCAAVTLLPSPAFGEYTDSKGVGLNADAGKTHVEQRVPEENAAIDEARNEEPQILLDLEDESLAEEKSAVIPPTGGDYVGSASKTASVSVDGALEKEEVEEHGAGEPAGAVQDEKEEQEATGDSEGEDPAEADGDEEEKPSFFSRMKQRFQQGFNKIKEKFYKKPAAEKAEAENKTQE